MSKRRILLVALSLVCLTGSVLPLTQNSVRVEAARKHQQKRHYKKATLKLPAGYTRSALLAAATSSKASQVNSKFKQAARTGMKNNSFSRDANWSESKRDDRTKVNLNHLTKKQNLELTQFSLRLLNGARQQLNLPKWQYSTGSQKLAADIASEYNRHHESIKTGHYVPGITRACKKNGLTGQILKDNYVEDMAGFYSAKKTTTMTQLKKDLYFGLKQMIFGYAGASESGRNRLKNYTEWHHAGDLFNTQGSSHGGDYDYYGFSFSRAGKVYSMHFIGVPTFMVKSPAYNHSFRP